MPKVLILSDKRPGHENQSIAYAKLNNLDYNICYVSFKNKFLKLLSYILDFLSIYIKIFDHTKIDKNSYDFIVSTGSITYYANKYFAKKFNAKNIALMLPKGFKKNFYHIFATLNDTEEKLPNLTLLPINLNYLNQTNYYKPNKKAIGFIIGGDNSTFKMDEKIIGHINDIINKFPDHEVLITTSPRTPKNIENLLKKQNYNFSVFYSENKINPIYDFTHYCEWVFLTQDSISMISESVCNGNANIGILKLKKIANNEKFDKFLDILKDKNLVIVYDKNSSFKQTKKLDLKEILKDISL